METDLNPNFLAKQRVSRPWRWSYRYIFYAIFAAILIAIWQQQHARKNIAATNLALIEKRQRQQQFNYYWAFLGNFFNTLDNQVPNDVHISEISAENNQISLQGQALNAEALNQLMFIFSQKLPKIELHLSRLDEKNNLNFSLIIQNEEDFSLLENSENNEIKNSKIKILLRDAQKNQLQINLIKPEDSKITIQLTGSYEGILQFLLSLKKDRFSPTHFDIKPNKNQLELEAKLDVIQ